MLDRILQRIQEIRYGELGLALASGGATFAALWTLFDAVGIPGSITTALSILYVSTIVVFSILWYLRGRRYERELAAISGPWRGGRALAGPHPRSIGVVAPISFWSTEYYVKIIRAVRQAAERERRDIQRKLVVLDVAHEELADVEETLADAVIKDVQGLILINMRLNDNARRELHAAGIPVVNITHQDKHPPCVSSILPDHTGFEDLLEHILVDKKSQSAILVTKGLVNPYKGIKVDPFRKEKRDLFQSIARKAGLLVQPAISLIEPNSQLKVRPGNAYVIELEQYLAEYGALLLERLATPVPPNTAFVFLADAVAIGFLVACQRSGRTAEDRKLRVTGFDNTEQATWFDLSSVDYQPDVIGRLAYEKLQVALDYPGRFSYTEEKVNTIAVIRRSSNW